MISHCDMDFECPWGAEDRLTRHADKARYLESLQHNLALDACTALICACHLLPSPADTQHSTDAMHAAHLSW